LGKSPSRWPCLVPNIVIGVAPLHNLTGEADRQSLVENLTDRIVTDLYRRCRGLSFTWIADEQCCAAPRVAKLLATRLRGVRERPERRFPRDAADQYAHLGRDDR
jgi:hypothetical protein